MPSLQIFDRRTLLGGDDIQPGCIGLILLRIVKLSLLVPIIGCMIHNINKYDSLHSYLYLSSSEEEELCNENHANGHVYLYSYLLFCFVIGLLLFVPVSMWMEYILLQRARVGTPIEPELRNDMIGGIFEIKISVMIVVKMFIVTLGIVGLSYKDPYYVCRAENDEEESYEVLIILVICILLLECIINVIYAIKLLNLPSIDDERKMEDKNASMIMKQIYRRSFYGALEDIWTTRCLKICKFSRVATCCVLGGDELAMADNGADLYEDIARVLVDYFVGGGVLDIVPSDVIAGLVMLQRIQKARRYEARRIMRQKTTVEKQQSVLKIPSWRNIDSSITTESRAYSSSNALLSTPSINSNGLQSIYEEDQEAKQQKFQKPYRCQSRNLLSESQGQEREIGEEIVLITLSNKNEVDNFFMAEAARYSYFALSIYTWMAYTAMMNPVKAWYDILSSNFMNSCMKKKKLCCASSCSTNSSSSLSSRMEQELNAYEEPFLVEGRDRTDNNNDLEEEEACYPIIVEDTCNIQTSALMLHISKLQKKYNEPHDSIELLYVSYHNTICKTPYAIFLDHTCKSIVITIRGSFSLEDYVTDGLIEPMSLASLGDKYIFDAKDQYCHRGILDRTKWILSDLDRHGLLNTASQYNRYSLRIVGHSLGAGCAALLSICLQSTTYSNLRCLCFSPPGGFISWKLANACKSFITSFVLDNDIVPRLSVQNVQQLREDVLDLFGRIKVPKIDVLKYIIRDTNNAHTLKHIIHDSNNTTTSSSVSTTIASIENELEYEQMLIHINQKLLHDSVPTNSKFYYQLQKFQMIQQQINQQRSFYNSNVELYPPGILINFIKTKQNIPSANPICSVCCCCFSCCFAKEKILPCLSCGKIKLQKEYTPLYIPNNNYWSEIEVSHTMFTDHFPDTVCFTFEQIIWSNFYDYHDDSDDDYDPENDTVIANTINELLAKTSFIDMKSKIQKNILFSATTTTNNTAI